MNCNCCEISKQPYPILDNVNCYIESLKYCANLLIDHPGQDTASSVFMHLRHNLFMLCFLKDNGLPIKSSDQSLIEIGIDSPLTPDLILTDKGIIIDFFVTNNYPVAMSNKRMKYGFLEDYGYRFIPIAYDLTAKEFRFAGYGEVGHNLLFYQGAISQFDDLILKVNAYEYDPVEMELDINNYQKQNLIASINPFSVISNQITNSIITQNLDKLLMELSEHDMRERLWLVYDYSDSSISFQPNLAVEFERKRRPHYTVAIWEKRIQLNPNVQDIAIVNNNSLIDAGGLLKIKPFELNNSHNHPIINTGYNLFSFQQLPDISDYLNQLFRNADNLIDDDRLLSSRVMTPEDDKEIAAIFLTNIRREWLELPYYPKATVYYPLIDPRIVTFVGRGLYQLPVVPSNVDCMISILGGLEFNNKSEGDTIDLGNWLSKSIQGDDFNNFKKSNNEVAEKRNALFIAGLLDQANDIYWKINDSIRQNIRSQRGLLSRREAIDQEILKLQNSGEYEPLIASYLGARLNQQLNRCKLDQGNKILRGKVKRNAYRLSGRQKKDVNNQIKNELTRDREVDECIGFFDFNNKYLGFDQLEAMVMKFYNFLFADCQGNFSQIPYLEYYPEDNLMERQKLQFYNDFNVVNETIKRKNIMALAVAIRNFSETLLNISNYRTADDIVIVDNCNMSNFYLMVKGNKIAKRTGSSKLFKLMFAYEALNEDFLGQCSGRNKQFFYNGINYVITPWKMLKVQQLKFGLELPTRITQILIGTTLQYPQLKVDCEVNQFKCLLMLNNRRSNEKMLHDLKYLTCNLLGCLGCYSDLLSDIFLPPKDLVGRYIIEKFLSGVPDYLDSCIKSKLYKTNYSANFTSISLQHPLSHEPGTLEEMECWLYSSYCMSKGVFTPKVEHRKNLLGILKIHDKVRQVINQNDGFKEIYQKCNSSLENVFDNDLYFNGDSIRLTSSYLKHYINNHGRSSKLWLQWEKIKHSDITEYANSSGLRKSGLYNPASWGKKGHQVIVEFLNSQSKLCKEKIKVFNETSVEKNLTSKEYNLAKSQLLSTKMTVVEVSRLLPLKKAEFNVADKVQWGGNREIYIMTHNLKNIQWALEQEFAEVAKQLENELISVSANKKPELLYNTLKKNQSCLKYYCVFDCRKWAPLSNFIKYREMIAILSGVLPPDFCDLFDKFSELYLQKCLYIKEEDYLDLCSTEAGKQLSDYWELDDHGSSKFYYLKMNYSFMMGIFNYLSSIMHSAVQLFYMNIVIPRLNSVTGEDVEVDAFAHSDDSGLIITFLNRTAADDHSFQILRKYLSVYELLQKCHNHLFSLKKCTVTLSYFEIISNIYFYGDILPVTTKFINGHSLNLTANGPSADIKSISSQITECVVNGASFEVAYLKEVMLCQLYSRFLYHEDHSVVRQQTIIELGGLLDEHPLSLLLSKSNANLNRLLIRDKEDLYKQVSLVRFLSGDYTTLDVPGFAFVAPFKPKGITILDQVQNFISRTDVPIFPQNDVLPGNHFMFYMNRMEKLAKNQSLDYSINDIDGIKIMQSYNSPTDHPNIMLLGCNWRCSQAYRELAIYYQTVLKFKITSDGETAHRCNLLYAPSKQYYDILKSLQKKLYSVEYSNYNGRPKPMVINFRNILLVENSLANNKTALLFKLDRRLCILNSTYTDYNNLQNSQLDLCGIDEVYNAVVSSKLLEKIYLTNTNPGTSFIDTYLKLLEFQFQGAFSKRNYKIAKTLLHYDLHQQSQSGLPHPDCVCFLYNSLKLHNIVTSGSSCYCQGLQLINWIRSKESEIKQGKYIVDDLFNYDALTIATATNWFCTLGKNQYRESLNWWVGSGQFIAHLRGNYYEGYYSNHLIKELKCYGDCNELKDIFEDLSLLTGFNVRFEPVVGPTPPTIQCYGNNIKGGFRLTTRTNFINYITNIKVVNYKPSYNFVKRKGKLFIKLNNMSEYKIMVCRDEPCELCQQSIKVFDKDGSQIDYKFSSNDDVSLYCTLSKGELIERFEQTKVYKDLYDDNLGEMIEYNDNHLLIGQPGTLLSALSSYPIGDDEEGMANYSYQFIPKSYKVMSYTNPSNPALVLELENVTEVLLGPDNNPAIRIAPSKEAEFEKLIAENGLANLVESIVRIDISRGILWYAPYALTNLNAMMSKQLPSLMINTVSYIEFYCKEGGLLPDNLVSNYLQTYLDVIQSLRLSLIKWGDSYSMVQCPALYSIFTLIDDIGPADLCDSDFYWSADHLYISHMNLVRSYKANYFGGEETKNILRFWVKKMNEIIETRFFEGSRIVLHNNQTINATPLATFDPDDCGGTYPLNMDDILNWDYTCDDPGDSEITFSSGLNTCVGCYRLNPGDTVHGVLIDEDTTGLYYRPNIEYSYYTEQVDNSVPVDQYLSRVWAKNFTGQCEIVDFYQAGLKGFSINPEELVPPHKFNILDWIKQNPLNKRMMEKMSSEGIDLELSIKDTIKMMVNSNINLKFAEKFISNVNDMIYISEGKTQADAIATGNYEIAPLSLDPVASAEISRIDPSLLESMSKGNWRMTRNSQKLLSVMIDSKLNNKNKPLIMFLRSLVNEAFITTNSDLYCDQTVDRLVNLIETLFPEKLKSDTGLTYPLYTEEYKLMFFKKVTH